MSKKPEKFKGHHFGPLNQPHAGKRILYRVRLRLVDEWRANDSGIMWRDALDDALAAVDFCLSQMRHVSHGH